MTDTCINDHPIQTVWHESFFTFINCELKKGNSVPAT